MKDKVTHKISVYQIYHVCYSGNVTFKAMHRVQEDYLQKKSNAVAVVIIFP